MLARIDPADLSLIWTLLLNAAVIAAAYRFARGRMTGDRAQAALDAALLWYAAQYAAVGLPGLVGLLQPAWISAIALLIAALLWIFRGKIIPIDADERPIEKAPRIVSAAVVFAVVFVAAYLYYVRWNQITFNDALTYHMPAAVHWLQQRRLDLFQGWFYYPPANTYSPLGGSMFIVWLLAPFHNDILARFVETPALLVVGLALFQFCREMNVSDGTAAVVATAAMLSRELFYQSMMTKDDLYVAAFGTIALVAMSPRRANEPLSPLRLGLAVGLLLGIKYTSLLNLPILLLAIDGPWKAGWRWRWLLAATVAALIAGPWYLRNLLLTGNPLFPMEVRVGPWHLARGLFVAAGDPALHTLEGAWTALSDQNAMPATILLISAAAILVMIWKRRSIVLKDPLIRTCVFGPLVGIALFLWRAPYPEARFVLPSFVLMFAACAGAIDAMISWTWGRWLAATALLGLCIVTTAVPYAVDQMAGFSAVAAGAVVIVALAARLSRAWPAWRRIGIAAGLGAAALLVLIFLYWPDYALQYRQSTLADGYPLAISYARELPMWRFVNEHVPADGTLAYTNMHLIYPMEGFDLNRRLVYAPTRPGVRTIADLPPVRTPLVGQVLTAAMLRDTLADADRATWIQNLRATGARYLVAGKSTQFPQPPEIRFAAEEPQRFHKLFDGEAGNVYEIVWSTHASAPSVTR